MECRVNIILLFDAIKRKLRNHHLMSVTADGPVTLIPLAIFKYLIETR